MLKIKSNFINKQNHYDSRRPIKFQSIYLIVILFMGLFVTILISTFSVAFVYSLSSSVANTTNTDLANKSLVTPFKELPDKIKEFIINDIVHKSKAALVVGVIDPNGTEDI